MSTLSSANVKDVNLVLKERTHMRLRINMLIFTHNLGNWLITWKAVLYISTQDRPTEHASKDNILLVKLKTKSQSW